MKSRVLARLALVAMTPLAIQACATKGFVRNQVAVSRAATDSALVAERDARVSGDAELAAKVAALRTDLDSLRTQFGARIAMLEDGIRFAMPVNFAFDDATVDAEARPLLERFARVANKYYPQSTITVEGFADPAGSQSYNLALSRERAENVARALQSLGLTGNPLRTIGFGEARLVTPGAQKDDPGAKGNRRVVFVIENAGPETAIAMADQP
jgi:outer membrane protein OmpA-like peptidoglycan-associated protein